MGQLVPFVVQAIVEILEKLFHLVTEILQDVAVNMTVGFNQTDLLWVKLVMSVVPYIVTL